MDLIPESGRSPGVGCDGPSPAFLLGEFHRQRNLVGYSPWGCRESDMTEATENALMHTCYVYIASQMA